MAKVNGGAVLLVWFFSGLVTSLLFPTITAEDGGNNDDQTDDYAGDDYIKYWVGFSLLPKRCMTYNDVDMIEFSVYQDGNAENDVCADRPIGTYVVPVPYFVESYLSQVSANAYDAGEDYEEPEVASYTQCTETVIGDDVYWVQLGCSDSSSKALAVNIYSDNGCETQDVVDGWDDSNIDVSGLEIPFKVCHSCVQADINDDQVDDQYYPSAPLCSSLWSNKQECDRSCQKSGHEQFQNTGWNISDKVLLSIMSVFGIGMLIAIIRRRRNMSKKELLLEEAAMSAAGLQHSHIIGIFFLTVIVIIVFALLGLKNITWALLLMMNTVLFAYLMKLTVDSGMGTSTCGGDVVGPDSTALSDSDYVRSTQIN
eukprot:CAMPEP_0183294066 /NCGR_PEP_ID=MMETSP0160_2-20130417/2531_1 /TAXON_ID=2839 ORGANISM="Odontella Sinensis, Strain Grunow 1884" /NCGR_SAMPLE_ID=MMETSP0160_2 /ASSEMBLY_ACC=CAM_ASM_000250 /LENGTH=368 /DNA_ID=CAMNT_0025455299 /DNA_START=41 /DNA_END=1147 /DNA_ORIENTATION=+